MCPDSHEMKHRILKFSFLMGMIFLGNLFSLVQETQAQPIPSRVQGRQLQICPHCLEGIDYWIPYVIKGVTWQPATIPPARGVNPANPNQRMDYGFFFDCFNGGNLVPCQCFDLNGARVNCAAGSPPGRELLLFWLRGEGLTHLGQDIPLIQELNANTVRVYIDFGINPDVIQEILNTLTAHEIKVVMTMSARRFDLDNQRYLDIVRLYKDHPAILMWSIGNEWNFPWNLDALGYANDVNLASNTINQAAQRIKQADPNHAVTTALGESTGVLTGNRNTSIVRLMPDIDLFGMNIYRGTSFLNLFSQWGVISTKPFYLSEFGTDSYHTTFRVADGSRADNVAGAEDLVRQARFDNGLWGEIRQNLVYLNPARVCVGGFVHEFNDEWWKVGSFHLGMGGLNDFADSYRRQDREGFLVAGHPDGVANEEYFGLVRADRTRKQDSFDAVANAFAQTHLPGEFVRGDANADGNLDLSDAIFILNWLFTGGQLPPCLDAADINDEGTIDISDPVRLLFVLFADGEKPPPPHPARGLDPTPDDLDCQSYNP